MVTHPKLWIVTFGLCRFVYYSQHHAEQMVRALTLNGTPCVLTTPEE